MTTESRNGKWKGNEMRLSPQGVARWSARRRLTVAFAGFGVAFGSLAHAAGIGPAAAVVLSATAFAGSAQFATVSVLGAGGSVVAAVVAAVLLNARYVPIGLSVAPVLGGAWWRRLVVGQLVVDESWAIAENPSAT
jgi:predicted branched-subunit amino acid permease